MNINRRIRRARFQTIRNVAFGAGLALGTVTLSVLVAGIMDPAFAQLVVSLFV